MNMKKENAQLLSCIAANLPRNDMAGDRPHTKTWITTEFLHPLKPALSHPAFALQLTRLDAPKANRNQC